MQTPESLVWELAVGFMTLKGCIVALNAMVTHGYCKIPFFPCWHEHPFPRHLWVGRERQKNATII